MITKSLKLPTSANDSFEKIADILKSLAQPVRLALIDELRGGEVCVCELSARIGAERSNVSRHLAVLLRAGIVRTRRVRQQIFYRLSLPCVLQVIDCIRASQRGEANPAEPCCDGGVR